MIDWEDVVTEDLKQIDLDRQRQLMARVSSLSRLVNDYRHQGEFLVAFLGDLIHDGIALHEYRDAPRLVFVLRDCGTHLHRDTEMAEITLKVWGDNDFRHQWFKLEERKVKEWVGEDRWEAEWVPCTGQEAIDYLKGKE